MVPLGDGAITLLGTRRWSIQPRTLDDYRDFRGGEET